MKAITIYHPWANWIKNGYKTIEVRTHDRLRNLVGKRIVIHAAKKFDVFAWKIAGEFAPNVSADVYDEGAIICTAFVYDHRRLDNRGRDSNCACFPVGFNLYGIFLRDIKKIKPVPFKGKQGIFNVPDDLIEYI